MSQLQRRLKNGLVGLTGKVCFRPDTRCRGIEGVRALPSISGDRQGARVPFFLQFCTGKASTPFLSLSNFLELEGFEVGVHDLHHDGTLYRSSRTFKGQA